MSFFTALSLSLSNLKTKIGRTLITALAGSIGIIGIASILALASGINLYIDDIEQNVLNAFKRINIELTENENEDTKPFRKAIRLYVENILGFK